MQRIRSGMMALVIVCTTAQASNWISLGSADSGALETFIDVSSIRIEGNVRRAWIKMVFRAHTRKSNDDGRYLESVVEKDAYNCAQEMKRDEAMNIYFEDGTVEIIPAEIYPVPWTPVAPDTVDAHNMSFICRWKP